MADTGPYPGKQIATACYGEKGKISFRVLVMLFQFV
jgi:hypothetical protein